MRIPVIVFFSFILLMGNFSCKKDEPVPVSAPPVFYFRGNAGSSNVNVQAGVNNYYMYSSFNQDLNNVYSFNGNLSVYNCTSCGNALQVKIRDFQVTAQNEDAAIETSLSPGYYPFLIGNGTPTEYSVTFNSMNQGSPTTCYWDFGDGSVWLATSTSATHNYARPGIYHVTHVAAFTSPSHSDTTEYNIRLGIPGAGLLGSFSPSASGETLTFYNSIGGTPPYTYYWDFGDGATSTQPVPVHTYANPGIYKVYMRVTDSDGGIMECARNAATQSYTSPYGEGFYFYAPTVNLNPFGLSNVTIEWKDAAGTIYTSDNSAQPSSSYFKLISVDDYDNNSSGQETKKIHFNFRCMVYNGTNSLLIDNGDAVIAVAYQ
ncbi:MAG TPA: PKD domain-containing protein [Bacteroidia bacterium]|nr:PKD domain-containing protein [Bacteroidia bacterium]